MLLDLIIVLIIVAMAILGYKQGFAKTLSHIGGWLMSILMGFLFSGYLKDFLVDHTTIEQFFYNNIFSTFASKSSQTINDTMPELIKNIAKTFGNDVASTSATILTSIIMWILSFLIIVLGIKTITWVIMHLFSKKHRRGMVSGIDGIFGLVFGIIKGVLIAFIVFAFLIPILNSSFTWFSTFFSDSYKNALITPYFYDYNVLLELINKILS